MVPHIGRYASPDDDEDDWPPYMTPPSEVTKSSGPYQGHHPSATRSPFFSTPSSSIESGSRHGSKPQSSSSANVVSHTLQSEIVKPTEMSSTSPPSISPSSSSDAPSPWGPDKPGPNHTAMYAMAGIVPVILIAFVGIVLFFFMRKRKRQQQMLAQTSGQQMKMHNNRSYIVPPAYSSTPTVQPHYAAPPSTEPPRQSPVTPQPVILGPIPAAGSSGTYLTGIDTSDNVSVHDHTGFGNPFTSPDDQAGLRDPFADGDGAHDEPPPPYRPRSIANLSRDSSLRAPPLATHSRTNLIEQPELRSPFADPRDEDAVSIVSGGMLTRNHDDLSVVSDLSYQEDPVVAQSRV